jgi:DNA-binding transcriptional MerR regulator
VTEWRIGEFAAATGLSVRTLRHYEQIGLLTPARRTAAGYRYYDDARAERLYAICALKSIGMPLREIAGALEGQDLADVLRGHLDHLEEEARRVRLLRDRLRRLVAHLDEPLPAGRLVELVDAMSQLERHLSARQLDRVATRRRALGAEGVTEARGRWRELGARLREQMEAGTSPDAPAVQALAATASGYIDVFAGGDDAIRDALARLRDQPLPDDFAGWDHALLDYLHRALAPRERPDLDSNQGPTP